jgi:protein-disulfide isomerase
VIEGTTMIALRRTAVSLMLALPLALAGCGEKGDADQAGPPGGDPIAPIVAPAGKTWVDTVTVTPEGGYRIGNPNAPLKLVEYASHTCSHCAEFSQKGAVPLDGYVEKGTVSYEIRNLIRDPIDLTIAVLARCGDPSTFHPLANQVWSNFEPLMTTLQAKNAELQAASTAPAAQRFQAIGQASGLLDFFAERGISRDQGMQCLGNTAKAEEIAKKSDDQSKELNITGTPTFFINGARIEGTTWEIIEPALQKAGAR